MLTEDFLRVELGEPRHFLAQHGDLCRSEQIGEDQKSVALVLRQLCRRQFHCLLRKTSLLCRIVAPNSTTAERDLSYGREPQDL